MTAVQLLTREQHCNLAGIDIEAFKSLQRRGLLPTADGTEEELGWKKLGYTPFEAMLLLIANSLADEQSLSRLRAAKIAALGYGPINWNWVSVRQTSAELVRGATPAAEFLYGEIGLSDGTSEIMCSTFARIARKFRSARFVTLVNVSRIAATMRIRASDLKIDLEEFWNCKYAKCPPALSIKTVKMPEVFFASANEQGEPPVGPRKGVPN
jgi:hypothetical protein